MLATSGPAFDDAGYIFEVKWDGVRAMTAVTKRARRTWGRECVDYTDRYPELDALQAMPPGTILDGELAMVRDGRPDFHALMARRHSRRPSKLPYLLEPVQYVVFDLLQLGSRSLLDRPLSERRALLHEHLPKLPSVSLCEGVVGAGKAFFEATVAAGHEGIVAKRLRSTYAPGKTGWRKIKQRMELPCVVIGYHVQGLELRDVVLATLVNGKLAYAGAVELGVRQEMLGRLEGLRTGAPAVPCEMRGRTVRWVRPEVFCTVRFAGWRPGGVWRDAIVARWEE